MAAISAARCNDSHLPKVDDADQINRLVYGLVHLPVAND